MRDRKVLSPRCLYKEIAAGRRRLSQTEYRKEVAMAIIVSQVKVKLEQASGREQLFAAAAKTARLRQQEIERAYLVKTSVDARKQDNILLVSSVGFELKDPQREGEVLRILQRARQTLVARWKKGTMPLS